MLRRRHAMLPSVLWRRSCAPTLLRLLPGLGHGVLLTPLSSLSLLALLLTPLASLLLQLLLLTPLATMLSLLLLLLLLLLPRLWAHPLLLLLPCLLLPPHRNLSQLLFPPRRLLLLFPPRRLRCRRFVLLQLLGSQTPHPSRLHHVVALALRQVRAEHNLQLAQGWRRTARRRITCCRRCLRRCAGGAIVAGGLRASSSGAAGEEQAGVDAVGPGQAQGRHHFSTQRLEPQAAGVPRVLGCRAGLGW